MTDKKLTHNDIDWLKAQLAVAQLWNTNPAFQFDKDMVYVISKSVWNERVSCDGMEYEQIATLIDKYEKKYGN